jgi:hypothetical protein
MRLDSKCVSFAISQGTLNANDGEEIGSCSCPGVVGVTVGGGVNLWQGVFGLLIDALVSVRLVTAEGRIIEVSERSNPNLFWGIRGAGANFGIITSATYRLNDQTNNDQLLLVSVGFPAEQSTSYFNMIESVVKTKPAELSFSSTIMWNRTSNAVSRLRPISSFQRPKEYFINYRIIATSCSYMAISGSARGRDGIDGTTFCASAPCSWRPNDFVA